MRLSRAFLLLCVLPDLVRAHSSSPVDANALFQNIQKTVIQTVNRLPKYLCTETVDRETFQPDRPVKGQSCDDLAKQRKAGQLNRHRQKSDRLRLDVAVSENSEMYSWAGDNRFENHRLDDLVRGGATSTGSFLTILGALFATDAATFTYNGEISVDGRTLVEYAFHVPVEKSTHVVGNRLHRVTVGYDGMFWADPKTFNLVRLNVYSKQLPAELKVCESNSTLDYGILKVNRSEFLIPQEVHWFVANADGVEFRNRTVFSACHEFLGESTLRFDSEVAAAPAAIQESHHEFPPALRFTLTLAEPIRTATAAAGDPFRAQLASAITAKRQGILAPKGAIVTGRIVRLERAFERTSQSLTLAIKTETIEMNGVAQPFPTRLGAIVKGNAARTSLGSLAQRSDPENSAVTVLRFAHVTGDYVINAGLEIEGKTGTIK